MAGIDTAGPITSSDRIAELDVLRGIALFGVLTMNFIYIAGEGQLATEAQLKALPTANLDWWAHNAVRLFIGDKANTVFATLFGVGFYLQLKRGEGRPGFESRYRRRLCWLLLFGLLNVFLLWHWDILHIYAIAGFFLLAMRRWSTRALVVAGALAAFYSDKLQLWLIEAMHIPLPGSDDLFSQAAVHERQALGNSGDYTGLVGNLAQFTLEDWLITGNMVAWIVYALGRFALGAAIGRSGVLDNIPRFVPLLRRIARSAVPVGLLLNFVLAALFMGTWEPLGEHETLVNVAEVLRSPVALLLAAGYCAGIVVALQRPWGRRVFGVFAPVGRMALTNYLAQGLIYAFVMYEIGPGLGLAGQIGSFAVLLVCIAFFAIQIAYSHWWLARFRFGPMEWLWRALTYGERPAFRRVHPAVAVPA